MPSESTLPSEGLSVRGAPVSPAGARVAIIDRDTGLLRVLADRAAAAGIELRALPVAPTPAALVRMRLAALVLDPKVVGADPDGYLRQVCTALPMLAVIVCTGPSSVAQRVHGLRLGIDMWVTKPCHPAELVCVIEAAIRRHRRHELSTPEEGLTVGELSIRPDLHQAYVDGVSVELTAREFEILVLLSRSDRVLRREEIYERVWGYAMAHGDRSVDVFVRKLRLKLRVASSHWDYIHTHFGVGYRFAPTRVELTQDAQATDDRPAVAVHDRAQNLSVSG